MIKLKLRHLNSEVFQNAILKLTKSESFKDFKSSYNMAKIARKVWNETKAAQDLFREQCTPYFEVDAEGKYVPAAKEEMQATGSAWKIKQDQVEAYMIRLNDMLDSDVEIPCYPLDMDNMNAVGITPQEAAVLEPILQIDDQPQS